MEMIVTRLVVVVNDDNHDNARTLLARNPTHTLVNGARRGVGHTARGRAGANAIGIRPVSDSA